MKINRLAAVFLAVLFFSGCKDNGSGAIVPVVKTHGYWILGEGSFGNDNSTLYYYDLLTRTVSDRFTAANPGRTVGNTANDMKVYGSKLYVAVDVSRRVLVLEAASGRLLADIDLVQTDGPAREPRGVACAAGKVFVSLYSGEVARIDTTTFAVDYLACNGSSRWNEGIAAVSERQLAVANSRDGNTLTLIDIPTFTVQGRVEVPTNPCELAVAGDGTLYVATWSVYDPVTYLETARPALHRIDLTSRTYATIPGAEVQRIAIDGQKLYGICTTYDPTTFTPQGSLVRLDLANSAVSTMISAREGSFNGVNVNPLTGYVYVMSVATDYLTSSILAFDEQGRPLDPISGVGNSANTVAFVNTVF